MNQKKIIIPSILLILTLFSTVYIRRIAENNTTIIVISYIFFACCFIAFVAYLWKLEKMMSKEERKKYLEQTIEKGSGYFVLKAGTCFSVLYILFTITLKYIENPNISFPYNNLWDIWIGYVWAILMWIIMKRKYEKMK
ncbi:MAG: hypothetical protein Q8S31_03950 [Alphaproteobacteria bacterium]|nr:hypothetical protein [Alphaproteobacteria bacterium]